MKNEKIYFSGPIHNPKDTLEGRAEPRLLNNLPVRWLPLKFRLWLLIKSPLRKVL